MKCIALKVLSIVLVSGVLGLSATLGLPDELLLVLCIAGVGGIFISGQSDSHHWPNIGTS